jgi:hypothetical protein
MSLPERTTYSFVIRIWLEETIAEVGKAVWRGHITHVSTGERRYLKTLHDIVFFITPYLEAMGVKLGLWWCVRQSWRRFRAFLRSRSPR